MSRPPEEARRIAAPLRFILFPFAALLALAAGLVFVVLLPICGVASIAEGIFDASWREVRGNVSQDRRDSAPQH